MTLLSDEVGVPLNLERTTWDIPLGFSEVSQDCKGPFSAWKLGRKLLK
jgi:hypothetical protein